MRPRDVRFTNSPLFPNGSCVPRNQRARGEGQAAPRARPGCDSSRGQDAVGRFHVFLQGLRCRPVLPKEPDLTPGEFIDHVKHESARVAGRAQVVGVMISPEVYEAMRGFCADRPVNTLRQSGDMAEEQGVAEDRLAQSLADER